MTEDTAIVPLPPSVPGPDSAVARCCEAWTVTYRSVLAKHRGEVAARMDANAAYRKAMPLLSGADNIRDFIACAAYGMLLGYIPDYGSSKLLYAAQIAHSALRNSKPPSA